MVRPFVIRPFVIPHEASLDQAAALTPSRIAAEKKLASELAV